MLSRTFNVWHLQGALQDASNTQDLETQGKRAVHTGSIVNPGLPNSNGIQTCTSGSYAHRQHCHTDAASATAAYPGRLRLRSTPLPASAAPGSCTSQLAACGLGGGCMATASAAGSGREAGSTRGSPIGLLRERPPAPSVSPACDIRLFASAAPASPARAAQARPATRPPCTA